MAFIGPESASSPVEFDVPFDRMRFDDGHCFLCGLPLGDDGTMEHLFPKWLLHRFDLWNRTLVLLNRTEIPYRKLVVPCCARCNNEGLSRIEDALRTALDGGYEAVRELDPLLLFQWCAKILFGVLFKELSLQADRRDPLRGTITTPQLLAEFGLLHDLLQSVHTPFRFPIRRPFSVLVINLHEFAPEPFDFLDSFTTETVAVRLGDVGIIVCCIDHGLTEETYGEYLVEIDGRKLHAIQFEELYVKTVYQRERLTRSPKMPLAAPQDPQDEVHVITMPLGGLSTLPLLSPDDPAKFAEYLWLLWEKWGMPYEEFFVPGRGVRTMMLASEGELLLLTEDLDLAGTIRRGGSLD